MKLWPEAIASATTLSINAIVISQVDSCSKMWHIRSPCHTVVWDKTIEQDNRVMIQEDRDNKGWGKLILVLEEDVEAELHRQDRHRLVGRLSQKRWQQSGW